MLDATKRPLVSRLVRKSSARKDVRKHLTVHGLGAAGKMHGFTRVFTPDEQPVVDVDLAGTVVRLTFVSDTEVQLDLVGRPDKHVTQLEEAEAEKQPEQTDPVEPEPAERPASLLDHLNFGRKD